MRRLIVVTAAAALALVATGCEDVSRTLARGRRRGHQNDGSDTWELLFEPNVFGSGQAIYVITSDDVNEN